MNDSIDPKRILIAAFMSLFVVCTQVRAQTYKDPHRPACADARCRKLRSFLKAHYCGGSPFGEGPEDGCDIKVPKRPQSGVNVIANFHCEWSESKHAEQCQQNGQPSPAVRDILLQELRKLGLPAKANGRTLFTVWEFPSSRWTLAEASYSHTVGAEHIELCQVIVIIDQNARVLVLRNLPFQKTDVDVPAGTEWSLVDIADAEGDGQVDVILLGNDYEDHWLEVVIMDHGSPRTVFSGLGYYL